jgi:uncharacterized protein YjbI with pentapeptide repeats
MPTSLTSESETTFTCDCKEWMRDACYGLPSYKTPKGNHYCVIHFPGKEKITVFKEVFETKLDNEDFNFRGAWFPEDVDLPQYRFTSKADFYGATFSSDVDLVSANFDAEADFNRVTFLGEVYMQFAHFGATAHFGGSSFHKRTNFRSAVFKELANFNSATFHKDTNFNRVVFDKAAILDGATFKAAAKFHRTTFSFGANLSSVTFNEESHFNRSKFYGHTNFISTTFVKKVDFSFAIFTARADFHSASFLDRATFEGTDSRALFADKSSLNLQYANLEKPDHILFHSVSLRPHWFVNVNASQVDFTNVNWNWPRLDLIKEIRALEDHNISAPHRLLSIACVRLAVNAEGNNRYEEASRFRFAAMDLRRKEPASPELMPRPRGANRARVFPFWRLSTWYFLASGYGERALQAFFVLMVILSLSALIYTQVGFARWEPRIASESDILSAKRDEIGEPLGFWRALTYSAGVMTLQKPEPRPATTAAQFVVLLETILGPVQAALLALAIRRKFMR